MVRGNPVKMKLLNSKLIGAGRPHEQEEKGETSTAGLEDERMVMKRVIS